MFTGLFLVLTTVQSVSGSVTNGTSGQELIGGCQLLQESRRFEEEKFECPATFFTSECIGVTGFSNRDFAASGVYCEVEGTYQLRVSDSLRYELTQRESDKFELLRVIKTARDKWVGIPIYAGFGPSLEDAEWIGYSLEEGDSVFDLTEPTLNATSIAAPPSLVQTLSIANDYRTKAIDACDVSNCDGVLIPPTEVEFCAYYWRAAAQLAELTGNNLEASKRYEKERACVQDQINNLALQQVPIPTHLRWKIAEVSHLLSKSFVKSGMFQAALVEVLVGLAHSPEKKQRRLLYLSLGDLRLAIDDVEGAARAYRQALDAVLLKGGMVEKQSFWSYFRESVGDFIAQISPKDGNDMSITWPNYAETRMSLLIGVEKGTEDITDDIELTQLNSTDSKPPFGHTCIIDAESLHDLEVNSGFCTQYVLSSQENHVDCASELD